MYARLIRRIGIASGQGGISTGLKAFDEDNNKKLTDIPISAVRPFSGIQRVLYRKFAQLDTAWCMNPVAQRLLTAKQYIWIWLLL